MRRAALFLLVAGASVLALAALLAPEGLVAGWLVLVTLMIELSLGALALLFLTGLVGRGWGERLAPVLRWLVALLPVALLGLVPLFAAAGMLFPWVTSTPEALPEAVQAKLGWLNLPFLAMRTVLCAVLWLMLAFFAARRLSDGAATALGLIVLMLTASIYDIDWLMGLEPEFVSTIHPLTFVSSMLMTAMAAAMFWFALSRGSAEDDIRRGEDIANLTFGFLLLRIYMGYMQWLIIWATDRPEEIAWYLSRTENGWFWVLLAMIALATLAGIGLALRRFKRGRRYAVTLAALVLAAGALETVWRAAPPVGGPVWPMAGALAVAAGMMLVSLAAAERREHADA